MESNREDVRKFPTLIRNLGKWYPDIIDLIFLNFDYIAIFLLTLR